MNTWVVGNHPIGHFTLGYPSPITTTIPPNHLVGTSQHAQEREEYGQKVFFMKARIMAGQADLKKNELGATDFQWVTKEELRWRVTAGYFSAIRNMLAER